MQFGLYKILGEDSTAGTFILVFPNANRATDILPEMLVIAYLR